MVRLGPSKKGKMTNIFLLPVISEKSTNMAERGEYTFWVDQNLTKYQIKKAVEEGFGVSVRRVRTKVLRGKSKKAGRKKLSVRAADRKLAIVKVGKDDKIDLFETKEKGKKQKAKNLSAQAGKKQK